MKFSSITKIIELTDKLPVFVSWDAASNLCHDDTCCLRRNHKARRNLRAMLYIAIGEPVSQRLDIETLDFTISSRYDTGAAPLASARSIINVNPSVLTSEPIEAARFTIAHELGHIINGDLAAEIDKEKDSLDKYEKMRGHQLYDRNRHEALAAKSHAREYAADMTAITLFFTKNMGLKAARSCFAHLQAQQDAAWKRLQQTVVVELQADYGISSHPPLSARLARLEALSPK